MCYSRYMGLSGIADSLNVRLCGIAVAKGPALPVAVVTWRVDTVKEVQRLRQEISKLEAKHGCSVWICT